MAEKEAKEVIVEESEKRIMHNVRKMIDSKLAKGETMAKGKEPQKKDEEKEKKEPDKKDEPPRPDRLEIDIHGSPNQPSFDVQVTSNKGVGIKAEIRIIEGTAGRYRMSTDEKGFFEYESKHSIPEGESREYSFRVIGTDINEIVDVDGPEKQKKDEASKPNSITIWGEFKKTWQNRKKGGY